MAHINHIDLQSIPNSWVNSYVLRVDVLVIDCLLHRLGSDNSRLHLLLDSQQSDASIGGVDPVQVSVHPVVGDGLGAAQACPLQPINVMYWYGIKFTEFSFII